MFGRLTDDGRRVIVMAQEAARRLNHNYIGTEHLMMGMYGLDGGQSSLCRALESFEGVTREAIEAEVIDIIDYGEHPPSGLIPFSARVKKVFELSLAEMHQQGQHYIGPDLLMLAILREGEGVAVQVLQRLNVEPRKLRNRVLEQMTQPPQPPTASRRPARPDDEPAVMVRIYMPSGSGEPPSDSPEWADWAREHLRQLNMTLGLCSEALVEIAALNAQVVLAGTALNNKLRGHS